MGYNPWSYKESDMTEQLKYTQANHSTVAPEENIAFIKLNSKQTHPLLQREKLCLARVLALETSLTVIFIQIYHLRNNWNRLCWCQEETGAG